MYVYTILLKSDKTYRGLAPTEIFEMYSSHIEYMYMGQHNSVICYLKLLCFMNDIGQIVLVSLYLFLYNF